MSGRKVFRLFGVTIVSLTEDQISENVMDQENNDENQNDDHDDFVFEPLPMNNDSSSPTELDLTLSMSLPWRLKKKIEDMGGYDIRKIIQKPLYKSDVNPNNNRFSIPENKIDTSFLKPREYEVLYSADLDNKKPQGIQVLVLDSSLQEFKLILKRWRMETCFTYNLTRGWRDVVQSNNFKQGDELQLWSFRWLDERLEEQLGFAIAKPFFNYNID